MSICFKNVSDEKILSFCDKHAVVYKYDFYVVFVNNVRVEGEKGSFDYNEESDLDYEGWCDVSFDVVRVEDENGDMLIVTNPYLHDEIINSVTSFYERQFFK